jgi:tetratricopeptide (TPR) repeat protein
MKTKNYFISLVSLAILCLASSFVLCLDGQTYKGWLEECNLFLVVGEDKAALECYEKALKINPSSMEALLGKGKALYKLGRAKEAIVCL